MIKQFSAGDITIRPFRTFKNWTVQSLNSASIDENGYSTYYSGIAELNVGLKISGSFFASGSPFYSSVTEPINPSGKYARNIYSLTNNMFYKNASDPMQLFGVERLGVDKTDGKTEVRKIHNKVVTLALNQSVWGEKVRPYTVKIVDSANRHEQFEIYDDGYTNLYISGSHFSDYFRLGGVRNQPPRAYFDTASIQYFVTHNDNSVEYISFNTAKEYMSMGMNVSYVSSSVTWSYDESYARNFFQPENEHFGESLSSWFKYVAVGSSMDKYSLSTARQGYAAIFKYDDSTGHHRLVKKFYCPFTQNALAQELSGDNSLLISIENNNFLMLEQNLYSASFLEDSFGYSVAVRDNFLAIGSPTGSVCVSGSLCFLSGSYPGFVYTYRMDKGGLDHWGITNALVGSSNGDLFGNSVAIDDDILVVGAPGVSGSKGAAYVYRRKKLMDTGSCEGVPTGSGDPYFIVGNYTWVRETILSSSVLAPGDKFGWAVAVDSGSVIVGTNKSGYGYATIFTCSYSGNCPTASWKEYSYLYADASMGDLNASSPLYANDVSNLISTDGFGKSVSISNNTALIGCASDKAFVPYNGYVGAPTVLGAAYFYKNYQLCGTASYYKVLKTFGDREHSTNNNFGMAVSIEGNSAAITSWPDKPTRIVEYISGSFEIEDFDYDATSSQDPLGVLGRVNIYNYDDTNDVWKFTGELKQNKEGYKPSNLYGYSVSICSDFLSVGAPVVHVASGSGPICYTYTIDSVDGGGYELIDITWDDQYGAPQAYYYSASMSASYAFCAQFGSVNVNNGQNLINFGRCDEPYASIFNQSVQASSSFPPNSSGSVFVYPLNKYERNPLIGNVFYKNGYFVLTHTGSNYNSIFTGTGSAGFELKYQGSHTIYEHEYLVSVRPGEFNYSTNPSSFVNKRLVFDVNQDGVFDFYDVDLIMRYLQKRKFLDDFVFDDDGVVLEQDTLQDYSWWNNDIIMLESEDVLKRETLYMDGAEPLLANPFTRAAFQYIESELVATGILDIDGDGKITLNDGLILSLYYLNTLNPSNLSALLNVDSTRRYVKNVKDYLNQYCLPSLPIVNPEFLSYQYSSSYDPTGSYLAPFITTIGLYENNQLVAVGKLGRPVKNLIDWPINIVVRFDT